MTTFLLQQDRRAVRIPDGVRDLASFRRWAKSDDFPEYGWYAYLNGDLWVDLSMERMGHNQVKGEVARVLSNLVIENAAGRFLHDRMLLTNVEVGLSTEPDGMYLSYATLRDGRARLEQGGDSVEVEGTPDMVLEVVSPASAHKGAVVLRDLYWRAGVREYWLADPRDDDVTFDILRARPEGLHGRPPAGRVGSLDGVRQVLPPDPSYRSPRLSRLHARCSLTRAGVAHFYGQPVSGRSA